MGLAEERTRTHPAARVLMHDDGPFVTAYLPAPSAVEDAAQRLEGVIRSAAKVFEEIGAPAHLVEKACATAQVADHATGDQLAVAANRHGAWAWPTHGGLERVHTWSDSLPRVAAVLAADRMVVPHIRVVVDRVGAEVAFVDELAQSITETTSVSGSDEHVHRGHPGGWSQRRFQQRAENTWYDNAGQVAGAVTELRDRTDTEVITIAGDERAVGFLVDQLPEAVRDEVIELDHGGRAAGVDVERMETEIAEQLAALRRRQDADRLETFQDRRSAETAVAGLGPTLRALFEGVAETLIIDAPIDESTMAFHGPTNHQVAATADTLGDLGIEHSPGPATETAVRAALSTGCEVHLLSPDHDGDGRTIGAMLRAPLDEA